MARSRVLDMMQNFSFWVFDASGPSGDALLSVFDPALGFSAISAPEISVETKDIQPGNWEYKRRVVKSAEASPVSFSRGVRFYDSDFYNWITGAIVGRQPIRRTLVVVHFLGFRPLAQATNQNMSFPDTASFQSGVRTPGRGWILYDCLDEETEILSENGWVGSDEVTNGDLVYSMNVETGKMELVPVDAYVRRPAGDEDMVSIEGRSIDFRVTGQHGVYLRRNGSNEVRRITANDLFEMSGEYQIPVSGRADFQGVNLSDDELRLIAWHLTDGHLKATQRLIICQSKPYKDDIRALLQRLGLHFTERIQTRGRGRYPNALPCHHFGIPKGTGHKGLTGWHTYADYLDKDVSKLLQSMSRDQFIVFWKELVKGDGSFDRGEELSGSHVWFSKKSQVDAIMQMGILRGFGMSYYESVTENGHVMYCMTASDREWMILRPKRMREAERPLTKTKAVAGEFVWCVSNRNKTLVTRRNGKVCILGNCLPTRYKSGSDFDASSSDVSIQELEVQPEHIAELTLATVSPMAGRATSTAVEIVNAVSRGNI